MYKETALKMPKKSKSAKPEPEPAPEPVVDEDDEDEDDEEDNEDDDEEEDEEDGEEGEEEEEAEEAPAGESDESRMKRLRNQRRNTRRNARQSGYRKWAKAAGLRSNSTESFGNDMLKNVFSHSDIVRMSTWAPHVADTGMNFQDFKTMLSMRDESLSSGPVRVLQANLEGFARKVLNEVVLRSMETQGPMTITAANVKSVLRPFNAVLRTEFSTPLGLVRAAQHVEKNDTTVLPRSSEEDTAIAEERKFCKANHSKAMRDADRAKEAKSVERKKRKSEASGEGSTKKKKTASTEASVAVEVS